MEDGDVVVGYALADSRCYMSLYATYSVEDGEPPIVGVDVYCGVSSRSGSRCECAIAGRVFVLLDENVAGTDSCVMPFSITASSAGNKKTNRRSYVAVRLPKWLAGKAKDAIVDVFIAIDYATVGGIECNECTLVTAIPSEDKQ